MRKLLIMGLACFGLLLIPNAIAHAEYYVEKGDTLYKIAKAHNMSLQDLLSLNQHLINPNVIQPGDYIVVRSENKAMDLIDYAKSLAEVTNYKYGGANPPLETDCSGWTQHIYSKFGVDLPRTARQQAATGKPVKFEDLQIGDLMFFSTRSDKRITHSGIYLGNHFWISNLNTEKDVEILPDWGRWTQAYFQWGARHEL